MLSRGRCRAGPFEDLRHERHVRAGEDGDTDCVGVLLHGRLDDLLRRLVQAGVDHFHARVAERARDDLGAAIVSVETGLCDDDSDLPRHGAETQQAATRLNRARCPRKASDARTQGAPVAECYGRDRGGGSAQLCSAAASARQPGGGLFTVLVQPGNAVRSPGCGATCSAGRASGRARSARAALRERRTTGSKTTSQAPERIAQAGGA